MRESTQQRNGRGISYHVKGVILLSLYGLVTVVFLTNDVYMHFNDFMNDESNLISFDDDVNTDNDFPDRDDNETRQNDEETLIIEKVRQYREERSKKLNFYSWFEGNTTDKLKPNADVNGTILDFAISGFAKCGTTSMEANLGYLAPMPIADVCTPIHQTVYYSHINWPKTYNSSVITEFSNNKILRGTKCPRTIGWLDDYSTYLPKTVIIVGIRNPIMFFQSFWNMMLDFNTRNTRRKSPYDVMEHCGENDQSCNYECPSGTLVCLHKTRFHLPLARIGRTALTDAERMLLAPEDKDGGQKLTNHNITNPIFLYEMREMNEDYMWDKLAKVLKVPHIPHDIHEGNNEKRKPSNVRINICDEEYDEFRAKIMPHAYNMSIWLCEYLVPVAKDRSRHDLIIADPDRFCDLVKTYAYDPCNRLVRYNNGTYGLGHNNGST